MVEALGQGTPQIPELTPEYSLDGDLLVANILGDQIRSNLELKGARKGLMNSVKESLWARVHGGRMLLEVRTLSFLQQPTLGSVNIIDFDDCLFSATRWHDMEYRLLEEDTALRQQGIEISYERAKQIYDLSKILIPKVAEKEPRYTPKLNLILLNLLAESLCGGRTQEEAWADVLRRLKIISDQVEERGEGTLDGYTLSNPAIQKVFENNSPQGFVHNSFVDYVLSSTGEDDIRIITTRGKIEGPLGQIDKLHSSGVMNRRSRSGSVIDLVVYSNDVKAEALIAIMKMLPGISGRQITVYDDNPVEIDPYLKVAESLGAPNIEVIQVVHPDAKRKDYKPGVEPTHTFKRGNSEFRRYSWLHKAASA